MSAESNILDDLLSSSFHGDEEGGAEPDHHRRNSPGDEYSTSCQSPAMDSPFTCAGCGGRVCDQVILLAAGQAWHGECLRCSQCQCELQTHPSLYSRDGSIYCQQDYYRLFAVGQCARCSQPIPPSAMVMRSGEMTFHPQCFSCQECDVTFVPGNLYCVEGRKLYCWAHYQTDRDLSPNHTHLLQNSHTDGEREEPGISPENQLDDRPSGGGSWRRAKRIRTCFRTEQLRALESYFSQKHNPDAKDWACLSQRTSLPKRVLQVWFQNARARLRRSLSKETSHGCASPLPPKAETMTTVDMSVIAMTTVDMSGIPPHAAQSLQTSTINHLEFSLLTGQTHTENRDTYNGSLLLNLSTQEAPGLSPLETTDFNDPSERSGFDSDIAPFGYY
ncbi:LIM/homeobox protein Lhx9-like [Chanos chanos]|uniref:LIM/homeobox protein Lhx9 n=1 Tax=Chanos chanos TaxID=29144 RepID=A0A6J2WHZ4_CHACN|nr:LIM/homeobox protein Lhx9-like [Chanos chanos]